MRKFSWIFLSLLTMGLWAQDSNSPPEVTNVVAQQVEISYDAPDRDGDLMTVSLQGASDFFCSALFITPNPNLALESVL